MDNTSVLLIFLCSFMEVAHTDPCTDNVPLPNLLRRGESSLGRASPLCDRYIAEVWYNTGQREMLTKTPSLGQCGTTYPIWLKDPAPPMDGKEYNLTACTRSFLGNCSLEIKVKFKSCGAFNVYYLRSVPSCPSAYCFGTSTRSTDTSKGKIFNDYYKQEFNVNNSDATVSSKVVPTNPCTKNVPLPNLLNRGGSSITTSSPLCDRYLAETWYSAGQREMPTKTPSLGRCGTRNPIWQKDTIDAMLDTTSLSKEFNITNSHSTDLSKDSAGEETFGYMSWPWLVLIAAVILLVTGITSALISCLVTRRRQGDTSLYNDGSSPVLTSTKVQQEQVKYFSLKDDTYHEIDEDKLIVYKSEEEEYTTIQEVTSNTNNGGKSRICNISGTDRQSVIEKGESKCRTSPNEHYYERGSVVRATESGYMYRTEDLSMSQDYEELKFRDSEDSLDDNKGLESKANITAVYYQQNVSIDDLQEETYYDAIRQGDTSLYNDGSSPVLTSTKVQQEQVKYFSLKDDTYHEIDEDKLIVYKSEEEEYTTIQEVTSNTNNGGKSRICNISGTDRQSVIEKGESKCRTSPNEHYYERGSVVRATESGYMYRTEDLSMSQDYEELKFRDSEDSLDDNKGLESKANITAVYYQQNVSIDDLQEETYYDAM